MYRKHLVPTILAFVLLCSVASVMGEVTMQVKLFFDSRDQLMEILSLNLDAVSGGDNYIEIMTTPDELTELQSKGITTEVVHADVTAFYRSRLDLSRDMGGYMTLAEIDAYTDSIIAAHPTLISEKISIGQTIEGRDIWAFKVSDNPNVDENEAEILFTAATHAREVITPLVLFHFIDYLTTWYGVLPDITDLVDNREIWFVIPVNRDGYYRNEVTYPGGGGMWRKNRRNNGDGTYGVDLNRNYGFHWGWDDNGSSPVTSSETYRGTGPFSEPETQTMRNFMNAHNFVIAIDYHSYSNLLLWPWGYDYLLTPDNDIFTQIGDSVYNMNLYSPGPGWMLYLVNGDSNDWEYGEQTTKNKILGMTVEVGSSSDGFWPDPLRIPDLEGENLAPNLFYTRIAGNVNALRPPTPPVVTVASVVDSIGYDVAWTMVTGDNPAVAYELVEMQDYYRATDSATNADNWQMNGFILSSSRSHSPATSFYSQSGNSLFNTMVSNRQLDVQAGDSLIFWANYEIETDWDYAYVEVSTDGVIFVPIQGNITTASNPNGKNRGNGITGFSGGWVEGRFDLSNFVGKRITVRFTYSTDGWVAEAGIWIDDVYPVDIYGTETIISSSLIDTSYAFVNKPTGIYYYQTRAKDAENQWSPFSGIAMTEVTSTYVCVDSDGDGYGDPGNPSNTCPDDNCPSVFNPSQADADVDGIGDVCDICPNDPNDDIDGDGVCGDIDNCPTVFNSAQIDGDGDGIGDVCDVCPNDPTNDADGDGICEDIDNCPGQANPAQEDFDGDGIGDSCDNCILVANILQENSDGDAWGDSCDNCIFVDNADQSDVDSDGVGDSCDNCPDDPNPDQLDTDSDGIGDVCESCCALIGDFNHDGSFDISDLTALVSFMFSSGPSPFCLEEADVNGDGTIDVSDLTCIVNVMFLGLPGCMVSCP